MFIALLGGTYRQPLDIGTLPDSNRNASGYRLAAAGFLCNCLNCLRYR